MNRSFERFAFHDLTDGPITKQLLIFALPLFAGSLIQLLYNMVDLMFVGRILGKSAAAAVGAGGLLSNCILGFFTGLGVGVGVAVSRTVGAKKSPGPIIHCAAGLTALLSVIFTVIGIAIAPSALKLMDTPPEVFDSAVTYMRFYLMSLPAIVSYNMASGILRALGNSRLPMLCQLAGGIINVFGNALFIGVFRWGVMGAALSTACSQGLAAVLTVICLCRLEDDRRLRFSNICIDRKICITIFAVGIPAAIQSIVITLSNVFVQSSINRLGVDCMAAFTAYFKVESFIYLPIVALGQAVSTFAGQNIGAGNIIRVKQGVRSAIMVGLVMTVSTSCITLCLRQTAFGLFSNDSDVIALGCKAACIAYPFYFLYVFLEVYASTIRGVGKALPSMVITLVNMCVVRTIILRLIVHIYPTAAGVAAVYPLTWAITVLCLFIYYHTGRWNDSTKIAA